MGGNISLQSSIYLVYFAFFSSYKNKRANVHSRYVLLAATSTFLLNSLHSINTGSYRRAAGVEYPAAYAPPSRTDKAAMCFNSAQRAHANYIENQPTVVPAILIAGTRFPLTTAGLGFAWVLSRWLYMTG